MIARIFLAALFFASTALAGEPRIVKVLPHFLDSKGRNALSPSLFERDTYQVYLRLHPDEISALRYDVQIKAKHSAGPLLLRLELRTSNTPAGEVRRFEREIHPARWGSSWAKVNIDKETTAAMGAVIAWRATLWREGEQLAAQESFLW